MALKPKNFSLPRSWQLIDRPDGDRIGECSFNGHTTKELVTLLKRASNIWEKGLKILVNTSIYAADTDMVSVAKTIALLFDSAKNVLEFYQKRNELGYCRGDSARLLSSMKELVYKEIKNAEQMISLCEKDNRIGFHSEAEGYKFFPAKLKEKIKKCEYLLKTDFKEVEERIHQGLPPLAYYLGEEEDSRKYSLKERRYEFLSDGLSFFSILDKGEEIEIELRSEKEVDFYLCAEYELFYPQTPVIIKRSGEVCIHRDGTMLQSVFDERVEIERRKWETKVLLEGKEKTRLLVSLKKSEVGFIGYPFKLLIKTMDGASWCTEQNPVYTLGKSKLSPAEFGWIIN